MKSYYEKGFRAFKMKVGGASFDVDLERTKQVMVELDKEALEKHEM